MSTAAWSAKADAAPCDADGDGCTTGDRCEAGSCRAGDAPSCDDALPCTEDACVSTGAAAYECAHTTVSGACLIGGACVADGAANPDNACQRCDALVSPAAWSALADATACDAHGDGCTVGDACVAGICEAGAAATCPDIACTSEACVSDGPSAFHCDEVPLAGFCFIGDACFDHGAVDPDDACLVCDVASAQTAWSPRADGTACDADGSGCTVGDSCRSGACEAGPAASCDDERGCTSDSCVADGASSFSCRHVVEEGAGCLIDGACREAGGLAPDDGCQVCDPARSRTAWSSVADGVTCDADGDGCTVGDACVTGRCHPGGTPSCGDGLGCTDDVCVSTGAASFLCEHPLSGDGCLIDGVCYGPSAASPGGDGCQVCDAAVDPRGWSVAANGRRCDADGSGCTVGDGCVDGACVSGAQPSCDDGLACTADACVSTGVESHRCEHPLDGVSCLIAGACVAAGAENPLNACEVCDPARHGDTWSPRPNGSLCDADGDGCTVLDSCQGGTCRAGISPDCSDGVECTVGACVSTGAHAYMCDQSIVAAACRVDGACYQAGEASPVNPCLVCAPDASATSWTPRLDGTPCDADGEGCTVGDSCQQGTCEMGLPAACDDGRGCTDDACVSNGASAYTCDHEVVGGSCLIGGGCYGDGVLNPDNACERCDAAASPTGWTALADATPCDADGTGCTVGDQCRAGQCAAGTPADCGDGLACTTDACVADGAGAYACSHEVAEGACVVEGACVGVGAARPGNACQVCDPARDEGGWSNVANGTGCDDGDLCTSEEGCIDGQCVGSRHDECTPGAQQTEACGRCGVRTRTCLGTCLWGPWSGCGAEGECAAWTTQSQSVGCGDCGQQGQTRTCSGTCSWGGWTNVGGCGGQGCHPGAVATQGVGCGYCGTQTQQQVCNSSCQWPGWYNVGGCNGQGECPAGYSPTQVVGCGKCGTKTQRIDCSGSCTWGGWYDITGCGGEGACWPGTSETRTINCGNCGHQSQRRTCTGACSWGGWANVGGVHVAGGVLAEHDAPGLV